MRFRRSLRFRGGLSFALFGGLVSLLLSAGLYLAIEDLEKRMVDEVLTAELQDYMKRRDRNPYSLPPAAATLRGYIAPGSDDLPKSLVGLSPGWRHLQLDDKPYRVVVRDHAGSRFYMLYDETLLQRRQVYFIAILGFGVIVMSLLSAAGGVWLAGRVISPVTDLAQRVTGLGLLDRPTPLAQDFAQDELGDLARAFESYLTRLQAFVEREREFTADVSHELRTPLTVINGAAEVLLANPELTPALRGRVARIARATREMSELTAALLVLAREQQPNVHVDEACAVEEVLRDVVEKHAHLLMAKPVRVDIEMLAQPQLRVARPVLAIVLGNLIRNAYAYTHEGAIHIRLLADRVTIEDTGSGMPAAELALAFQRHYKGEQSRGAGIGLSLVKRICDRYGWSIELDSEPGRGTCSKLLFPAIGKSQSTRAGVHGQSSGNLTQI
jgi:signal transduction histidine kinase